MVKMAADERARQRREIDYRGGRAQDLGESLRTGTLQPNVDMFRNYFTDAANKASTDYATLMPQYQEFAKTGGYTPEGLSAIRARALSPVRAMYANANREVDRSKVLQGGYSPGYGVLKGRMAREGSQAASDATTNAEAAIAQMVQQGRLAGLGGATNLYGTSPGAASTFGNQVLGASGQLAAGVGNEMDLQRGLISDYLQANQVPGKWQGTMGKIGDVLGLAQAGAGLAYPWLTGTPGFMKGGSPNVMKMPNLYTGF